MSRCLRENRAKENAALDKRFGFDLTDAMRKYAASRVL